MKKVRIQFASVAVALLCCGPVWSQTATLTGYVLDRENDQPIDGARVSIVGSPRPVLSNGDGKYTIPGLTRGKKVSVTYAADGYGTPEKPDEVSLDKNPTEHTIHLYKNIPLQAYWIDVSKAVQGEAEDTQPQIRWHVYGEAWKDVEGSTLSAEAKWSAAHAFAAKLSPEAFAALASFQAYSKTDLDSILKAKDEFGIAIDGNLKLQRQKAVVPGSVAADIAAQQLYRRNSPAEIPDNFFQDFKGIYGDKAANMLKDKVTLQNHMK